MAISYRYHIYTVCLIPDERARYYGGAGPVGTGPIQRPTYTNIVSVMKSAIVTSRTSLLLAALAHRATGSAAPTTAASEGVTYTRGVRTAPFNVVL